ncbi:hypothetical protein K490DRAFT_61132 [Saccharata proteae CBS 121410]|uniref:Uncharacterized protein n=1 Tax=Saccharata proteae CBS 121410 TaxID=1314787 RepID=A0A9P4HYQ5_9PEZI|nr:hypothetical protein K490DRAFT_61132 [Saccharata proteae CBS 121410]
MRNFTSLVASVLLFCLSFAWAQSSTITSTRTVVQVVTETHFHSTPVLETMNVTSVFVSTETPVAMATPSSGFQVPYSMNGTAIMTPTPAGKNAMTSLASAVASGSAKPSQGAAVPLKMDAALAVLIAGVGYMVL